MQLNIAATSYNPLVSDLISPPHRWELPVLHYHEIMVIYPYPFLVKTSQLFSWIISINDYMAPLGAVLSLNIHEKKKVYAPDAKTIFLQEFFYSKCVE